MAHRGRDSYSLRNNYFDGSHSKLHRYSSRDCNMACGKQGDKAVVVAGNKRELARYKNQWPLPVHRY
jgi:hypothetical protein